jgi:hypothetical protein
MQSESENGLTIDAAPSGRNGSATLTAKLAGEVVAVEKLDLTKPKQRADFIGRLCNGREGINKADVEAELLRLAANQAAKPEAPAKSAGKPDAADLLEKMPESVRVEARVLLDDPNLMRRVVEDIGALGVAGEKELAATVYLVGTSRTSGGDRARPNILGQELCREARGEAVPSRDGPNGDTVDATSIVLHAARKPSSQIRRDGRAEPAGKRRYGRSNPSATRNAFRETLEQGIDHQEEGWRIRDGTCGARRPNRLHRNNHVDEAVQRRCEPMHPVDQR